MRQPISLRQDYDAPLLRRIARESEDADQVRRLLALAVIYEEGSRTEAAEVGGVTLQVVRDWVLRFNAHGPEGLIDRKAPGQPSRLNEEHRACEMPDDGEVPLEDMTATEQVAKELWQKTTNGRIKAGWHSRRWQSRRG